VSGRGPISKGYEVLKTGGKPFGIDKNVIPAEHSAPHQSSLESTILPALLIIMSGRRPPRRDLHQNGKGWGEVRKWGENGKKKTLSKKVFERNQKPCKFWCLRQESKPYSPKTREIFRLQALFFQEITRGCPDFVLRNCALPDFSPLHSPDRPRTPAQKQPARDCHFQFEISANERHRQGALFYSL